MHPIELALVSRLRAWYWHMEVERLALNHFYRCAAMPPEALLKRAFCALVARAIHFFVTPEALLLEPPQEKPAH
ncbi:MAG: hypothetical protein ACE5G8_12060 [Anaerolineae bacterium]